MGCDRRLKKRNTHARAASRMTFPSKVIFPTLTTKRAVGPSVSISWIILGIKAKHLSPSFTISPWILRKKTLWSVIRRFTYWDNFCKAKHYINLLPTPKPLTRSAKVVFMDGTTLRVYFCVSKMEVTVFRLSPCGSASVICHLQAKLSN